MWQLSHWLWDSWGSFCVATGVHTQDSRPLHIKCANVSPFLITHHKSGLLVNRSCCPSHHISPFPIKRQPNDPACKLCEGTPTRAYMKNKQFFQILSTSRLYCGWISSTRTTVLCTCTFNICITGLRSFCVNIRLCGYDRTLKKKKN